MVSPFILIGKRILQDLCHDGAGGDDKVPDDERQKWEKWLSELSSLRDFKILRCYKPASFRSVKTAELHNFTDASNNGYGLCSYLRLINDSGEIHCSLVMAKSRGTSKKPVTIPRLELTAAVVAVRISTMLGRELEYEDVEENFWTENKVVLGYITNEARRFHVFVANRVQQIGDHTLPKQWKHVDTSLNPADHASRGLHVQDLINNDKWWNGPDFPWSSGSRPVSQETMDVVEDDPEVKRVTLCTVQTHEHSPFLKRLEYFSEWQRVKRQPQSV